MTYPVNAAKQDPRTGIVAVKTGKTDPDESWQIVMTSDGTCHYAADADVDSWDDLAPITNGGN
jgi:hypothetical protein